MIGLRRLPVRWRIFITGVVPALLVVVLLTVYHLESRWGDLRQERNNISLMVLEHLSASAEYPLISGNYDLLQPLVQAALAQPMIVSVVLLDASGREVLQEDQLTADSDQSDLTEVRHDIIRLVPALDEFSEFGDNRLESRQLGTIVLTLSESYIHGRILSIVQDSVIAGLLVVILAGFISRFASLSILLPLEKLGEFIARLAAGHSHSRMEVSDGAEVGHLQLNTNRLAESLERAELDQQEYTRQLMAEQAKTQQASKAKSDFLAMMSHELRTPLNGAIGMLQLLERDNTQEEFDDYKRTADRSLTHLTQLLEDVLVVVDTEKNKLPVAFSEQRLPDVLYTLLLSFRSRALEKQLSFVVEYSDRLLEEAVRCDPSLIRQVVRHLVDNAIKFTDEGMVLLTLSVSGESGHETLKLVVEDSGIGIDASQKERVLEAFSQANSSFSRRHEGVGLGLTITHHICRVLGGELQLEDSASGGARVVAEIPVSVSPQVVAEHEKTGQGFRTLIVEDNPVNLKVTEKMLGKAWQGLTVSSVMSGEECLKTLQDSVYDLILMDCQMPGLDGFETTERLRDMGVNTPVVACTANTTDQIRERCLAAGMNDYMAKPLTLAVVKQILTRWLPGEALNTEKPQ